MRHRIAGRKLGRPTEHRWALYRNQVSALLGNESITTTEAKAKEVRRLAEMMITLGKDGSLAARRRAAAFISDKRVLKKLFDEVSEEYRGRTGGYVRLVKVGPRVGDNAPMVHVELIK